MAKYGKNKQGLYETSRTYDGNRVKFRSKTCAIVDRKIREYDERREKGRKFKVVAEEWYARRERDVSESTYAVYGCALSRIQEHFGDLYIRQIRPLDVDRYIMRVEDRGYAKQTVQIELSVLKQLFSYAVRAGDIDVNPAREVSPSRGLPEKKRSALTEEQGTSMKLRGFSIKIPTQASRA